MSYTIGLLSQYTSIVVTLETLHDVLNGFKFTENLWPVEFVYIVAQIS